MCVQVTYAGLIEDMFESMQQVGDPACLPCGTVVIQLVSL